jgi:hypothetical protein
VQNSAEFCKIPKEIPDYWTLERWRQGIKLLRNPEVL